MAGVGLVFMLIQEHTILPSWSLLLERSEASLDWESGLRLQRLPLGKYMSFSECHRKPKMGKAMDSMGHVESNGFTKASLERGGFKVWETWSGKCWSSLYKN